ncbi:MULTISPECIES: ferritin-like protein [unclassified Lysobacter]|uniref:ferritin-like domain-containing protein n=1 Tax=unclassified Lysobacter TaxID=2635362 RepID=UPI0006FB641A|nr:MULTISPECIES: ferritin-like protein [unclassified Lysobacter]KRA17919.1 hypothetical protein ASD69_14840 [Lysobacter sp. Root604]KRD34255.1 hypothetical protein ASE35_11065 [Lysobacter sp. Root916]KRD77600.1 hypothetical protein ASE43_10785 [Lysobacter sp. Root983]
MIRLRPEILSGIRAAETAVDLHKYLQNAVELEHSTIPPYLTAMLSLRPGSNRRIAAMIRSIIVQEMLHMSIAANILIAIGGSPRINTRDFVPKYPGPLPMDIGDGLRVGIEAFSMGLVKHVFMAIEQPEEEIPIRQRMLQAGTEPEYATIGEFYDAIQQRIRELGQDIFVHTSAPPQVVNSAWFPPDKLFPIEGPESACHAIEIIKLEGEGSSVTPFQSPGDPAHFYMFGSIVAGRELITTPEGYAYAGVPIEFDPSAIWPLKPNCKIADFAPGTQARSRIEQFAYNYSALLNALHQAFNGTPQALDRAIGLMYDLRVLAVAMMQTDIGDGTGRTVGPSYEYIETQGGMG